MSLGKGNFGKVSRWQSRLMGGVYAVKQVMYNKAYRAGQGDHKKTKPERKRVRMELRAHIALYHVSALTSSRSSASLSFHRNISSSCTHTLRTHPYAR